MPRERDSSTRLTWVAAVRTRELELPSTLRAPRMLAAEQIRAISPPQPERSRRHLAEGPSGARIQGLLAVTDSWPRLTPRCPARLLSSTPLTLAARQTTSHSASQWMQPETPTWPVTPVHPTSL